MREYHVQWFDDEDEQDFACAFKDAAAARSLADSLSRDRHRGITYTTLNGVVAEWPIGVAL